MHSGYILKKEPHSDVMIAVGFRHIWYKAEMIICPLKFEQRIGSYLLILLR